MNYQYTDKEAAITLDFKDFEPYSEENASRTFKYDTEECVVRATVEDVLKVAQAEGVSAESNAQNFEINFEAIMVKSAEGGIALAEDGSLVISADGTIVLTDGVKTLTVTVQGITKLSEAILEAEGVKIQVEAGKVPLGSAAQYTSNTAEKTAQLVEDNGLAVPAGEESGFASADLKIVRKNNNNNEEIPATGLFKVTLAKSSLIPEGMMLDQLYHIHSATNENGETVIQADPLAVTETEDSLEFEVKNFSDIVASYTLTKMFTASDGNTYEIKVEYGAAAKIPADAALSVTEITKENEAYAEYLAQALAALGVNAEAANEETEEEEAAAEASEEEAAEAQNQFARFFDISIMQGEEKVQPQANVTVSIKLADAPEGEELKVVHFDEADGLVVMDAETKTDGENTDVQFVTGSFSTYGIINFPKSDPQGATDLAGRAVLLSREERYLTSNFQGSLEGERPMRIYKSSNRNDAAIWYFEASDEAGKYYIYTLINGEKNYIVTKQAYYNNAWQTHAGDTTLQTGQKSLFTAVKNNDGTYTFSTNDRDTTYYLNEWNGSNGNGFAGYNQENNDDHLTLTIMDDAYATPEKEYMVILTQDDENYYLVQNDGTLEKVEVTNENGEYRVKAVYPMMWDYEADGQHLSHKAFARTIDGSNSLPNSWYYQYIDPSSIDGINEPSVLESGAPSVNPGTSLAYDQDNNLKREASTLTITSDGKIKSANGNYYIGISDNGTHIVGQVSSDQAATVLFATADQLKVMDNDADLRRSHIVNHIDISIEGSAKTNVPLAYGKYYDVNGKCLFTVTTPQSLTLSKEVEIVEQDIKNATIEEFMVIWNIFSWGSCVANRLRSFPVLGCSFQ